MAKILGTVGGILFFVLVGVFFFNEVMKTPVAEISLDGKCLRVLNEEGQSIPEGCELLEVGKLVTEYRYVAR